jgi:hypothetical protein
VHDPNESLAPQLYRSFYLAKIADTGAMRTWCPYFFLRSLSEDEVISNGKSHFANQARVLNRIAIDFVMQVY